MKVSYLIYDPVPDLAELSRRVERLVLVSPAGGLQNQPLLRAIGQLGLDAVRESPKMIPVALPDYLRFGPIKGNQAPINRSPTQMATDSENGCDA